MRKSRRLMLLVVRHGILGGGERGRTSIMTCNVSEILGREGFRIACEVDIFCIGRSEFMMMIPLPYPEYVAWLLGALALLSLCLLGLSDLTCYD